MFKSLYATFRMGTAPSQLTQKSAVDTVNQWRHRPSHELIFDAGRAEINRYFEAVNHLLLQSPNPRGINDNPTAAAVIARLKSEFEAVLRRQSDNHAAHVSTTDFSSIADSTANVFRYEDYSISDPPTADVLDFLRNIAQGMDSCGKIEDCIRVYKSVRTSFLKTQLHVKLRFQELNTTYNLNRQSPDELKVKIEVWIQLSKICVKKLFEREKFLCDKIFDGIGDNSAKEQSFVGTVNEFAVGLFGFVEGMSKLQHEYDRMEAVLGLYDAFFSVLPDVEALFSSVPGDAIISKYVETQSRIESKVCRMLHDFGNKVLGGTVEMSDERGGVDQVTEYVMKQLNVLIRNKNALMEFIKSPPSLRFDNATIPDRELGDVENLTLFQRHLILILVVLQKKLEEKSRASRDTALAQSFMISNLHYIVKKIEAGQELKQMIGNAYLKELQGTYTLAVDTYKVLIRSKFPNLSEDESLYVNLCCFRQSPSKTAYKNKLNEFNTAYEEIQSLNPLWTIPDAKLREDIQSFLRKHLVPSYTKFLEKFRGNHEFDQIRRREVKHSVRDLDDVISNLFVDA